MTDWRGTVRTAISLLVLLALGALFWFNQQPLEDGPSSSSTEPSSFESSIDVVFSPPASAEVNSLRGGVDADLAVAIDAATSQVDGALYDLNLWSIRDALLRAHRRGIEVRLVMESDQSDRSEVIDLQAAGVPVHFDGRDPLMHHKFIIIDQRWVWTGSMNWTINGVYRNNNNVLIFDSVDMAANFTSEFDEMFEEDRFGELSLENTPFPFLVVGEAAVEVAFSPEDGAAARVLRTLDRAQEQIDIMAFSFTSDPISEALVAAHERGVRVRGVFEAERADDLGADFNQLRASGLAVRLDTNPNTMHHKVILIDGRMVITGSYNFTRSAEERNDENILLIDDDRLYQKYSEQFEALYQSAVP